MCTEMATIRFKIGFLTYLLLAMVVMEEFKPVLAKREQLKQRTKALEKSVKEIKEMMNEQEERMKKQEERLKEQEEKMKDQEENIKEQEMKINEQEVKINEQEEKIKEQEECKACSKIKELNETLNKLQGIIDTKPVKPAVNKDCAELYKSGKRNSGVYTINPDGSGEFDVFCDQTKAGGGWTVFQKRQDGSVEFYRGWTDYKQGFGNVDGEFWLGLDKIHRLTSSGQYKLRVDLEDFAGNTAYAEYDSFGVANEDDKYKLSVTGYSGTAGDSLAIHNGNAFTTKDQDNDNWSGVNCAVTVIGAWWYNDCYHSNLNGEYNGNNSWLKWRQSKSSSLKRTEMKIRPADF